MIAMMFWATEGGIHAYIIIWAIIFLVFVVVMMILFYIGGKGRIKEEKELIEENQKKEDKMAQKAK